MTKGFAQFHKQVGNPWLFRLFMLKRLPAAFFAGLRIRAFNENDAVVAVRYKWFTQNPFHSMYFAVQSMAAEMSTGLLASAHVHQRNPRVSMLVTGLEASFVKRVTGTALFTCSDGAAIALAIEESIRTGEAQTFRCESVGRDTAGDIVSTFYITWSFKPKLTADSQ